WVGKRAYSSLGFLEARVHDYQVETGFPGRAITMPKKIKVAVNGYGDIGKRIADAVRAQEDMELLGGSDVATHYRVATAITQDIPIYASTEDAHQEMSAVGYPVAGRLPDLLDSADVVVYCTPAKIGADNLDLYRTHGVKSV